MVYLEQWAHDNYQDQKKKSSAFKKTKMIPRQDAAPTTCPSQSSEGDGPSIPHCLHSHFQLLLQLVSPKNNNTNTVRSRFAKAIILEVVAHVQQRVPLVERNAGLYTFREDLKDILSCPLLTNFQFWCQHHVTSVTLCDASL